MMTRIALQLQRPWSGIFTVMVSQNNGFGWMMRTLMVKLVPRTDINACRGMTFAQDPRLHPSALVCEDFDDKFSSCGLATSYVATQLPVSGGTLTQSYS